MYRTTKIQRKNMERIKAWLAGEPFKENSRDKNPQVPDLQVEQVMAEYMPAWEPKDTGQFFTPLEMGAAVLSRIWLEPGARVLEPCAGIGNLLYNLADWDCKVDAYEADESCVALGQKLFPWTNWIHEIPFDCLSEIEGQYDFCLVNPPFGTTWAMGPGETMSQGRAKCSEHIFLELATRALKPGGQAVFIAPYNFVDKIPKSMRAWFDERMELADSWGPLPGEFSLTKIKVHAFYFTRLEDPVEAQPVIPALPKGEGLSLVIEREVLKTALNDILPVVSKNSSLELLRNVLLTIEPGEIPKLRLEGTNLEMSITTRCRPVKAGGEESICIPAHLLYELLELIPDGYISLGGVATEGGDMFFNEALTLTGGGTSDNGGWNYQTNLKGWNPEEFPVILPPQGDRVTIPADQLLAVIKQVKHFVAKEDQNPSLKGLLFRVHNGQLTVVATNRNCLALSVEGMNLPDMDVVIELDVLNILARHLKHVATVGVVLTDERVLFQLPDLEIVGRLMGGSYPDYTKILPASHTTQAVVNHTQLLKVLTGAKRFSNQANGQISFIISGNGNGSGNIKIAVDSSHLGDYAGQMPAVVSGEAVTIVFIADQVAQGVGALPGSEVLIEIPDQGNKPVPVTFVSGGNKQVIMPLGMV